MQFDSALNVAWLLLGAFALAASVRAARSRLHRASAIVIFVALFPYISASDDLVRFDHCVAQHTHSSSASQRTQADDLMRLYEAMDAPLMASAAPVTFTPIFVCLPERPARVLITTVLPQAAGRSPPTASAA